MFETYKTMLESKYKNENWNYDPQMIKVRVAAL